MLLSSRFDQALLYAVAIHAGQTRKASEVPFIAHLLGVTSLALEYGANEDQAIAALLHDAAEDAGGEGRLADIRVRFGEAVAGMVRDCTDTCESPKPAWQARKEAYIAHLPHSSAGALLVSCCDKLYNTRTIVAELRERGAATWEKFRGGRDGSLWYYRTLVNFFMTTDLPRGLVDELSRTVETMEALTGVSS
ncbi:MAG TPA: HD domain-containing protein [Pirellulales bacterium]|nr:HD domain-containing protein [Pirellulales bacterium]